MPVCPGLCFWSDWRQTCVLDHGANRDRADLCRPDPIGNGLIPRGGGEISERRVRIAYLQCWNVRTGRIAMTATDLSSWRGSDDADSRMVEARHISGSRRPRGIIRVMA